VLGAHRLSLSWRGRIWAVVAVATAARALTLVATAGYHPQHDDRSYFRVARSLVLLGRYPILHVAHVGWLPSAYRPPGWPLVLAGVWSVTGISVTAGRIALLVLGVAACVLGAQIARRLAGDRAGLVAGLVLAVDPLLLAANATLESETLFTALLLAALLAVLRAREAGSWRWTAAAGVLVGAAALTRTNALVLIPLLGWLVLPTPRPRRWLRHSALAIGAAILVISPWTIRNATELHHFVPVSTETGNTLAGTYNITSLHHHARWLLPSRTGAYRAIYARYADSPQLDDHLRSAVLRWVAHHPTYPLVVSAWNSARLLGFDGPNWATWSLHTMSMGPGWAMPVWLATLLITMLAAAELTRRRRGAGPVAVVAAVLLLTTVPVTGEMRLAIPLQAVLVLLASCAVADRLGSRLGREERRRDVALA
jgi:4-amino-4-deoxy-L-arabinose transferase-like glycosyltransferase